MFSNRFLWLGSLVPAMCMVFASGCIQNVATVSGDDELPSDACVIRELATDELGYNIHFVAREITSAGEFRYRVDVARWGLGVSIPGKPEMAASSLEDLVEELGRLPAHHAIVMTIENGPYSIREGEVHPLTRHEVRVLKERFRRE